VLTNDGAVAYDVLRAGLPVASSVLLTPAVAPNVRAILDHAAKDGEGKDAGLDIKDIPDRDAFVQILADHIDAASNTDDPLGLPIVLLETKPAIDTMAIIYSGDGGWRDIDRQVGAVLQKNGIPVVGVDALRYFWSERKPQEAADDLGRIIEAYRKKWNVGHVLLIGYSFGADVLPATYNLLPPQDKEYIAQLSLLSLSHDVRYEVSLDGWLGIGGDGEASDPVKDLGAVPPALVQCIYGTEDEGNACVALKDKKIETIGIEGDHHFDRDYPALTAKIISSLKERLSGK
jgi:type IV secretory pathway VirJ component